MDILIRQCEGFRLHIERSFFTVKDLVIGFSCCLVSVPQVCVWCGESWLLPLSWSLEDCIGRSFGALAFVHGCEAL